MYFVRPARRTGTLMALLMTLGSTGWRRVRPERGVHRAMPGRKDILPAPCLSGMGVFPSQSMRQVHRAMPLRQVRLMQRLAPMQVVLEQRRQGGRQGGKPVLVALARTDGPWLHLRIAVLDPGPGRFHHAPSAPAEELGDHWGSAVHEREHGGTCFAGHDHEDGALLVGTHSIDTASMVEDALGEEHQGMHRLVLDRGSDVAVHGQVRQEGFDLRFGGAEVLARPQAVETDEPDDPLHSTEDRSVCME
jgi:hypothetical protein